jgi:hypothetical protein
MLAPTFPSSQVPQCRLPTRRRIIATKAAALGNRGSRAEALVKQLVDGTPHTRSTSTPTGANAGPRSPCRRSCARATGPSAACPRPLTQSPPRCRTRAAAPCQVKATGRHPRRWSRCSWTFSSPDQAALTLSRARCQPRCPNVKRRAKPQWHHAQMDLTSYKSKAQIRHVERTVDDSRSRRASSTTRPARSPWTSGSRPPTRRVSTGASPVSGSGRAERRRRRS